MSHTYTAEEIKNRNRELAINAEHAIEQIKAKHKIYAAEINSRVDRLKKVKGTAMRAVFDPTPQLLDVMQGLSDDDQALIKNPTKGLTPSI